tara:strand:+ start:1336 stop:1656 length:321 start_codon:yes stop_codon:yes gene_type:complete
MDQMNIENQPEAEPENYEGYGGEEQYASVEGGKKRKRKSKKVRKSKKSKKSKKSRKSRKVRRTKRGGTSEVLVPAFLLASTIAASRELNKSSVNKKSLRKNLKKRK